MSTPSQDVDSVSDITSTSDFASRDDTVSVATTLSTDDSTDELTNQMSKLTTISSSDIKDSDSDLQLDESDDTFGSKILNLSGPRPSRSLSDPGVTPEEEDNDHSISTPHNDDSQLQTEIPDNPIDESDRLNDDLGELSQVSESLRTESINTQEVRVLVESSFEIDAVACEGVPMVHIVRVMSSFLLSGRPGEVLPDSNVRVSVKSLALSCIAQAVRLHPESFLVGILPNSTTKDQLIRDILLFNAHPDPQLRGVLASVLSHLITAGLKKGRYLTQTKKLCKFTNQVFIDILLVFFSLNFNQWSETCCSEQNIGLYEKTLTMFLIQVIMRINISVLFFSCSKCRKDSFCFGRYFT